MKNNVSINATLAAAALSAVLMAIPLPSFAVSGVPTMDAITAGLLSSNAVAQAKQALDAFKQAKEGIDQVRQQYDHYKSIITGNDMLGGFLNDPALNRVLPMGDWADVYSTVKDISSLRERYGLTSSDSSVQAKFDRILAMTDALERNYGASNERVNNAEQLRNQLNQVDTPQQKADLQLRYEHELLEQQNQQMRMANLLALTQQQEKMENAKNAQAFSDYMTGKTKTLPKYD